MGHWRQVLNWATMGFAIVLLSSLLGGVMFASPVRAAEAMTSFGERIFTVNCARCHIGGNNVILPEKSLHQEALAKYGMESLAAIQEQVTYGKNAMPAFQNSLTPTEIDAVSRYILTQVTQGWKDSSAEL